MRDTLIGLNLCAMTVALSVAVSASPADAAHNAPPPGFTALFNGENLDGWWGWGTRHYKEYLDLGPAELAAFQEKTREDIRKHWRVENGELVNDGNGLYLTTNRFYGDFELRLEYKTVAKADSGIYLRGIPQVQIWDSTEAGGKWKLGADKGSGGLWNNPKGSPGKDPLILADKPFGQWNRFRVIMVGQQVTVWLNDKLVVDNAELSNYFEKGQPVPDKGPIQLQTHGGEIRWRNLFIREIPPGEAAIAAADTPANEAGFESVFNGKDLTGWAGAVDNYTVTDDGAIMCKPGKGGTLYTEQKYADFIVKFEFKLPPGGNNGLAIRYPGKGNPAYHGMCELQVLDNTHPKYAKLDERQYHGSAYGMVAAKRGHLKPIGQWNEQTVTVKGSTIKVVLNGATILDCDLSKVTEYMGNSEHPGKTLIEGHFGFAGHSDPVQFRNIRIKKLEE